MRKKKKFMEYGYNMVVGASVSETADLIINSGGSTSENGMLRSEIRGE